MNRSSLCFAGVFGLAVSCSRGAVVQFSRADDLDFSGEFVYAVTTSNSAGGLAVGDAVFTSDPDGPAGVITGFNFIQGWGNPYHFSGSAAAVNDINLGAVMDAVEWSASPLEPDMTVQLTGLVPGHPYQLQLLFGESCCPSRVMDVRVDGVLVADEFNVGLNMITEPRQAVVHFFYASSSTVLVTFPEASTPGDHNETLNAFTLEHIPEPGTAGLLLLTAALVSRRRIRG